MSETIRVEVKKIRISEYECGRLERTYSDSPERQIKTWGNILPLSFSPERFVTVLPEREIIFDHNSKIKPQRGQIFIDNLGRIFRCHRTDRKTIFSWILRNPTIPEDGVQTNEQCYNHTQRDNINRLYQLATESIISSSEAGNAVSLEPANITPESDYRPIAMRGYVNGHYWDDQPLNHSISPTSNMTYLPRTEFVINGAYDNSVHITTPLVLHGENGEQIELTVSNGKLKVRNVLNNTVHDFIQREQEERRTTPLLDI